MDRVVQKILKRYREYKKKIRTALEVPVPAGFVVLLTLLIATSAQALVLTPEISYYGEEFYQRLQAGDRDDLLIKTLRLVIAGPHQIRPGQLDEIGTCEPSARDCYMHQSIGYTAARKIIMGDLYIRGSSPNYYIKDVYCEHEYGRDDFRKDPPAPNTTPDQTVLNVEHTWPQSRFNGRMDKGTQKADLHHLFPADSKMNSIRGNLTFGEVDQPAKDLPCHQSKLGSVTGSRGDHFEPPQAHKGNVARALFYFSIRYQIKIDPTEERFMRKWHREDPPDQEEIERNAQILRIQGNRNPFIDYPELADHISDF